MNALARTAPPTLADQSGPGGERSENLAHALGAKGQGAHRHVSVCGGEHHLLDGGDLGGRDLAWCRGRRSGRRDRRRGRHGPSGREVGGASTRAWRHSRTVRIEPGVWTRGATHRLMRPDGFAGCPYEYDHAVEQDGNQWGEPDCTRHPLGIPDLAGDAHASFRRADRSWTDDDCQVKLLGKESSRRHAEIRCEGPLHMLKDLGSRNGRPVQTG